MGFSCPPPLSLLPRLSTIRWAGPVPLPVAIPQNNNHSTPSSVYDSSICGRRSGEEPQKKRHAPKAAERCVPRTNFSGIRRVHELGSLAAENVATNSSLRPNRKRQLCGLPVKLYELFGGRTNRPRARIATKAVKGNRVHRTRPFSGSLWNAVSRLLWFVWTHIEVRTTHTPFQTSWGEDKCVYAHSAAAVH